MTRLSTAVLLAGVLAIPGALGAQRPAFEFRGHRLGETLQNEAAFTSCDDGSVDTERICYDFAARIGDAPVDLSYSYLGGKLYHVFVGYAQDDFESVAQVVRARYGAPRIRTEPFRTVGGTRTANVILTWPFRDGSFELRKYGTSLTKGYGSIESTAGARAYARLKAAATRAAAARDLGAPVKKVAAAPVDSAPDVPIDEKVYFEFQVEKQVQQVPGTGNMRYPEMLKSANIEGEVLAQFVVDETGHYEPGTFKVLKSSHDLFTAAVKNALPNMKFYPAEVGGRKVKQFVQQPFTFTLSSK